MHENFPIYDNFSTMKISLYLLYSIADIFVSYIANTIFVDRYLIIKSKDLLNISQVVSKLFW